MVAVASSSLVIELPVAVAEPTATIPTAPIAAGDDREKDARVNHSDTQVGRKGFA